MKGKIVIPLLGALTLMSACLFMGNAAPNEASAAELCEHQFELTQEVPAKCTEQGYTLYTCSVCGETKKDHYTKETGHDYTESVIAATCTSNGVLRNNSI